MMRVLGVIGITVIIVSLMFSGVVQASVNINPFIAASFRLLEPSEYVAFHLNGIGGRTGLITLEYTNTSCLTIYARAGLTPEPRQTYAVTSKSYHVARGMNDSASWYFLAQLSPGYSPACLNTTFELTVSVVKTEVLSPNNPSQEIDMTPGEYRLYSIPYNGDYDTGVFLLTATRNVTAQTSLSINVIPTNTQHVYNNLTTNPVTIISTLTDKVNWYILLGSQSLDIANVRIIISIIPTVQLHNGDNTLIQRRGSTFLCKFTATPGNYSTGLISIDTNLLYPPTTYNYSIAVQSNTIPSNSSLIKYQSMTKYHFSTTDDVDWYVLIYIPHQYGNSSTTALMTFSFEPQQTVILSPGNMTYQGNTYRNFSALFKLPASEIKAPIVSVRISYIPSEDGFVSSLSAGTISQYLSSTIVNGSFITTVPTNQDVYYAVQFNSGGNYYEFGVALDVHPYIIAEFAASTINVPLQTNPFSLQTSAVAVRVDSTKLYPFNGLLYLNMTTSLDSVSKLDAYFDEWPHGQKTTLYPSISAISGYLIATGSLTGQSGWWIIVYFNIQYTSNSLQLTNIGHKTINVATGTTLEFEKGGTKLIRIVDAKQKVITDDPVISYVTQGPTLNVSFSNCGEIPPLSNTAHVYDYRSGYAITSGQYGSSCSWWALVTSPTAAGTDTISFNTIPFTKLQGGRNSSLSNSMVAVPLFDPTFYSNGPVMLVAALPGDESNIVISPVLLRYNIGTQITVSPINIPLPNTTGTITPSFPTYMIASSIATEYPTWYFTYWFPSGGGTSVMPISMNLNLRTTLDLCHPIFLCNGNGRCNNLYDPSNVVCDCIQGWGYGYTGEFCEDASRGTFWIIAFSC